MDKRITIPFSPSLKKADTVAYIGFDREPLAPISREQATAVFEALGEILGTNASRPPDPISPSLEPVRDAADAILEDRSRADLVAEALETYEYDADPQNCNGSILRVNGRAEYRVDTETARRLAATSYLAGWGRPLPALGEEEQWAGALDEHAGEHAEAREPSPDLKEALSVALRSYTTRPGRPDGFRLSGLLVRQGARVEDAEEELDHLADHLAGALPAPALSTTDVGALKWAVRRAAEAALPIGEGELRQRAMAAAGRLTARPALSAREATAIQLCAAYAQMAAENMAEAASERALAHASTALATVDRLTGAPGSPTAGDPPEPTEERILDFDHLDPEAVADQILGLRRRLEHLEHHLARVPVVEGRLKIQGARLDALEMHRRGVNDGTAELAVAAERAEE